jgi:hypothetical protein
MRRSLTILALGAGGALALAPAASADVGLSGGSTTLRLSSSTAKALGSLGVKVAPTGRARAAGGGVRFPISGGSIDPRTAAGRIDHSGGLRLSAGGKRITLSDYRVAVGRKIMLSARVGSGRVHILELAGRAKVTRSGFNTNVSGLRARLTAKAATALNGTFGVTAFKKGLTLGTVTVRSQTDETELAATGATAVAIDPAALSAIVGLGITPGVIDPATLAGTTASFPITGGQAQLDLSAGTVSHSGGLSLAKGATTVALTDFDVVVGAKPQLLASINGASQKVAILDIDLTGVTPAVDGREITVAGAALKLTQGAADALNAAFATSGFTAGLVLGRATVTATGR